VAWTGTRPNVSKDCEKQNQTLKNYIEEGFNVTHVTSSTVNDVMYVYHFLEREAKK
jgi:hypothetical protein